MGLNRMGAGFYDQTHTPVPVNIGSGQVYPIPSGQFQVLPGLYTFLQWYDPITASWRTLQTATQNAGMPVSSDGFNWRLANLTGGAVGAVVTNGGTGYTNGIYYPAGFPIPGATQQAGLAAAPTVTFAAGGGSVLAKANLIVGGAINTTITITTAGAGYTRPPVLLIDPPPLGGVPATAVCALTTGAISSVTVTNQGAGYKVAPKVTIVPWPGDAAPTTAAVLTVNATLALSGQVVAIVCVDNGATMNAVPAITFSPASTSAATAIMCFAITTGVAQTAASHMGTGNIGWAIGAQTAGSSTSTNPAITIGQFTPRPAYTAFNTTAGGGITFVDGGLHQIIPTGIAYSVLSDGTISAASTAVAQTVGGVNNDLSYLLPL
jgi:hypothetical protein